MHVIKWQRSYPDIVDLLKLYFVISLAVASDTHHMKWTYQGSPPLQPDGWHFCTISLPNFLYTQLRIFQCAQWKLDVNMSYKRSSLQNRDSRKKPSDVICHRAWCRLLSLLYHERLDRLGSSANVEIRKTPPSGREER